MDVNGGTHIGDFQLETWVRSKRLSQASKVLNKLLIFGALVDVISSCCFAVLLNAYLVDWFARGFVFSSSWRTSLPVLKGSGWRRRKSTLAWRIWSHRTGWHLNARLTWLSELDSVGIHQRLEFWSLGVQTLVFRSKERWQVWYSWRVTALSPALNIPRHGLWRSNDD